MNNESENKSAGLKYLLFIGIPVIIILGVLGAYYQMTSPLSVITKTINTAYKNVDSFLTENEENQDINEIPISMKGNLTFKTDLDLNGYEKLQDYNYDINIDMDIKNEFVSVGFGMNDQGKKIIQGNFYQIGKDQYLESQKLIDKIIKLPESDSEFKDLFDFQNLNLANINQNIKDIKYILKICKEAFEETLDKQYVTREKTDITINGRQIKATKITYLLDKENQQRTWKKIQDKLNNDQTFIETVARLDNITEEQVKENLKQDLNYKQDYSIVIYTEGWNQNVIKVAVLENTLEQITYINYDNDQTISIQNDVIFTIKECKKNSFEIDYNIKSSNIKGTLKINEEEKNKNERNEKYYFTIESSDINLEINLFFNIVMNKEIQIPNVSNAVKQEDLTTEDIGNIFGNLEKSLEGTILYKKIEQNIM